MFILKRLFDIIISFFGLLFLSPFFLVIHMLIHRDSPGPTYFQGKRIGRNGKPFHILKFRTMYEIQELHNGSPLTTNGDSRVTPFGRWLRHTKVNELPQLWNVLKGDMSLVGPRPEDPSIVDTWSDDIRKEVLSVRPGITSPASIIYRDEEKLLNGDGAMDQYLKQILPDKLRLDQLYVRNISFLGDLDVIFTTLVMLLPRLRATRIPEKSLFSGPFYTFFFRYLNWIGADFLVALISISLVSVIWRLINPLDVGIGPAILIALGTALLLSTINALLGLGKIAWRYAPSIYALDLLVSSSLTVLILLLVKAYFIKDRVFFPTGLIVQFGFLTFIGLVIIRYRERLLLMFADRWMVLRGQRTRLGDRVLIIGAGDSGQLTAWLLGKSVYANWFTIEGFVDDDYRKFVYNKSGYPVLGTTREIPDLVEKRDIAVIFFAISNCSVAKREQILSVCRSTKARVAVVPDLNSVLEQSLMELNIKVP